MTVWGMLGCGEIGSAVVSRMIGTGQRFCIASPTVDFGKFGWPATVETTRENKRAVEASEYVLVACPVVLLDRVLREVAPAVMAGNKVLVSMCGKGSVADMARAVGGDRFVVRIMPNTPTAIGLGVTGYLWNPAVEDSKQKAIIEGLKATGKVDILQKEEEMVPYMASYSCSPAYNYMMMEAISDAATYAGVPRALANRLSVAGVKAAAKRQLSVASPPRAAPSSEVYQTCSDGLSVITGVGGRPL